MAQEITAPEILSSRSPNMPSRRALITVTVAFAVAVLLLTGLWLRSASNAAATCDAQYNALVSQAKTDLINGNRAGAIRSLIDARSKLRACETPTAKDVNPVWPH